MHTIATSLICALIPVITVAQGAHYIDQPDYTLKSPKSTFHIKQRASPDEWWWQTWICPTSSSSTPYQLRLWHEGEVSWPGRFTISPDEKYILHIQKTGSGDNYAEVYARGRNGKFCATHKPEPAFSLSGEAWQYFSRVTGIPESFYHAGADFHGWEPDGESVGISLHGADVNERFYVWDWRLHYNLQSRKFFLTRDERAHNRGAIIVKRQARQ